MKLDYIYLDSYKNLKDFEVTFNEGSSVNALIGNNGSGKSNVLEALPLHLLRYTMNRQLTLYMIFAIG